MEVYFSVNEKLRFIYSVMKELKDNATSSLSRLFDKMDLNYLELRDVHPLFVKI